MDTVVYVISILMWILCPAIIGLILLQGAAGDISSAFGGGGQLDASLGVGAHRKMAQVTGALAFLFFVMVLILAYPHKGSFKDLKNSPAPVQAPAVPPTPLKADAPKAPEAPKADAPKAPPAEAPKADAPKADAPVAPPVVVPKLEAPTPPVEAPKAETPVAPPVIVPKAEAPAPAPVAPPVEAPKAEAPKVEPTVPALVPVVPAKP